MRLPLLVIALVGLAFPNTSMAAPRLHITCGSREGNTINPAGVLLDKVVDIPSNISITEGIASPNAMQKSGERSIEIKGKAYFNETGQVVFLGRAVCVQQIGQASYERIGPNRIKDQTFTAKSGIIIIEPDNRSENLVVKFEYLP
ncbi:MAG: hypothetical protein PW843_08805 [Azospirillaceae bacterium]|nr:hypothetical protein [Azospirillaceae bacterium]